jgi:hypothetical protein
VIKIKLRDHAGATLNKSKYVSAQEKKAAAKITDEDIFNFGLNLESLETEYYLRGTTEKGMDDADAGSNPGAVTGRNTVPWQDDDLRQFMEEVAANELAHVRFYRKTLGKKAVSRPAIDLTGFAAASKAAGLGDNLGQSRRREGEQNDKN